ncbi:hypothetical protein MESS4_330108 [Mesorhizobium sp. STM 4661]|nr:hypothetical protein MESS4_330108 [Mesorhizobium sp. STM 4661]
MIREGRNDGHERGEAVVPHVSLTLCFSLIYEPTFTHTAVPRLLRHGGAMTELARSHPTASARYPPTLKDA